MNLVTHIPPVQGMRKSGAWDDKSRLRSEASSGAERYENVHVGVQERANPPDWWPVTPPALRGTSTGA